MNRNEFLRLKGFYENELTNRILAFWLPRCEDREFGGYLNCFDNSGEHLMGYDKYTWSQGRFVWLFARLASTRAPLFTDGQREEFLRLAKVGRDFLMEHCLLGPDDVRCVYLMERDGSPKRVEGWEPLDMSIYADCFAVLAMAGYGTAAGDRESYAFGKRLYESVLARVESGKFNTLPYPLPEGCRAHGIPMILSNVTREMYGAAERLDPAYGPELLRRLAGFTEDILKHFADESGAVHEVISADNRPIGGLLGQHANPGHTIEDMWFMMDAAGLLGRAELVPRIAGIARRALEIGWDEEFGGILHYSAVTGGSPLGGRAAEGKQAARMERDAAMEPVERQVLEGWGDKLWWVHAEALYTTLLCYRKTGDPAFLDWHERVFDYTFRVFPNRDPQVREWKQICRRDGTPQDKVVALPVKDPFHIARDLILILELLEEWGQL